MTDPTDLDPADWFCLAETTRAEWLDANGHVNVRFYLRLVARAIDELMDRILCGGERREPRPFFLTLEARIFYKAELLAGQEVAVLVRPLARSEKTLRALVRIVRTSEPPAISAECEWKGAYVDPETRRARPLPDEAKAIFDDKLAAGPVQPYETPHYPPGLGLPPPPRERLLVSTEGEIQPEWIDRMGGLGIEHSMHIFNHAAGGYFQALGFDDPFMRERGWGTFGVGSHLRYLREMKAHEPYRVVTTMTSLQRKTASYRHTIYLRSEPPIECATCDHTSLFVDWKTRRPIPLPEVFKERIGDIHGMKLS